MNLIELNKNLVVLKNIIMEKDDRSSIMKSIAQRFAAYVKDSFTELVDNYDVNLYFNYNSDGDVDGIGVESIKLILGGYKTVLEYIIDDYISNKRLPKETKPRLMTIGLRDADKIINAAFKNQKLTLPVENYNYSDMEGKERSIDVEITVILSNLRYNNQKDIFIPKNIKVVNIM